MNGRVVFLLTAIASLLFTSNASAAGPCTAVDKTAEAKVAAYVAAKYHVSPVEQLSLVSSEQANADCYWKFEYQVLASGRRITMYLTPDRKYLVPALYARGSDPLADERKMQEDVTKTLLASEAASKGPRTGKVTLVEFSDFECPFCKRFTAMLQEVLPSEPDVHVVFRNYPLEKHPWARSAAQIAACALVQNNNAFWKMHDFLFGSQKEITTDNVKEMLFLFADTQAGVNHDAFHDCVELGMTAGRVSDDIALGKSLGVHATPTIFLNGMKIEGVKDSAQLKELIAKARAGQLFPSEEAGTVDVVSAPLQPAPVGVCTPTK